MKHPFISGMVVIICTLASSCSPETYPLSFDPGKKDGPSPIIIPPSDPGVIKTYSNPVYKDKTHADPTVIRVGNVFYSYSTDNRIRILASTDLVNWTYVNTSFTASSRPNWAKNADGTSAYLWAPDIAYIEGQYVLYYSLAAEKYGIGVATSHSPEGPFTDRGKLIQNGDVPGVEGCIDPCFFTEDGHNYLIWGSHKGIFITELTSNGLSLKSPASKTSITKICKDTWEGPIIYKRGNYYYFFGSTGVTILKDGRTEADITYNVQVGRSTSLFGPYLNKSGGNLLSAGTYQLLKGNDAFIGPGHHSEIIEDDNGDTWMLYHAFIKGQASKYGRILMLDRIDWDANGWPVMNGGNGPTITSMMPVFN